MEEKINELSTKLEDNPTEEGVFQLELERLDQELGQQKQNYRELEKKYQKLVADSPEFTCLVQYQGRGNVSDEDGRYFLFISQDDKYKIEISDKNPIFKNNPPKMVFQENKNIQCYKLSWKVIEKDKRLFTKKDFIRIEKVENKKTNLEYQIPTENNNWLKKVVKSPWTWLVVISGAVIIIYLWIKRKFF